MESYLQSTHFDLITPDGAIHSIKTIDENRREALVRISGISPAFVGFSIDPKRTFFNIKSTLAQLGVNGIGKEYFFDKANGSCEILVDLIGLDPIGKTLLHLLTEGCFVGKLFAADDRRRVREPDYLRRMFGRHDRYQKPLLFLGNPEKGHDLILEKIKGTTVAFLPLRNGRMTYDKEVFSFLPVMARILARKRFFSRDLLPLYYQWQAEVPRIVKKEQVLLAKTSPLHVRTVFAKVVDHLLPQGYHHTTASVLQPDTEASGDIYEFFGSSEHEISDVPLEFYTLEPHREYVFFSDRDQLQASLEKPEVLFSAFETAPTPKDHLAAVFIFKGTQLASLSSKDWIVRSAHKHEFPGISHPSRQAILVEQYIKEQPSYPFLEAIENNLITSQGILLCRHFPSPLLKKMFLSSNVINCLKAIYFSLPSRSHGDFFSHEDRAFLHDLAKFGIPVFWVDKSSKNVLQYVVKPEKDTGMFVPVALVETFRKATFFGVYGSNLVEGNFEKELTDLLHGVLKLREEMNHPLLCKDTPLALLTGGGPGAMEVGNRVAQKLGILSCANIVDFRAKEGSVIHEQEQNPYIFAKMTYRLDRLVERQAEFHLDFPIFLVGGIGTDFEYTLEEVRRKVGSCAANPILLFGTPEYWKDKVSSRFQCNLQAGTIKGSEWVSNCFYCIQTAKQGLSIYRQFLKGNLSIGKEGKIYKEGFCIVPPQNP
jgi:predicted Rossmann-fold nucleotide-binding protein